PITTRVQRGGLPRVSEEFVGMRAPFAFAIAIFAMSPICFAQNAFVNWETPPVHPMDITPDGTKLLVVNLPDDRLELYDISSGTAVHTGAIPVGLDPVSVRARTNDEVWVVSHISDSVNIISLSTRNVVATVRTDDEPCDVVFAGTPQKAFV